MKNLLTGIFLLTVVSLHAQKNVAIGPIAGFGHSSLSGEGDNKYKPYGEFGAQLIYSTNSHLGLGANLQYSIEGGKKEFGSTTYETRLNYLRIPVKLIYFFNDYGDKIRPKISAGPSLGLLLGGKQTIGSLESGVKDDFKKGDIGIVVSAGLNYRLIPNTWLTLDLDYYNGFADVSKTDAQTNHNRNIGIHLGLAFGITTPKSSY